MKWALNASAAHTLRADHERFFGYAETALAELIIVRCPVHRETPLRSLSTTPPNGAKIFYKDEASRFEKGSFKALGGAYAVLHHVASAVGPSPQTGFDAFGGDTWRKAAQSLTFTCATDGNHGRAVALGARLAGAKVVVHVHPGVDPQRRALIAAEGAEIRIVPGHYDESVEAAAIAARAPHWALIADTCGEGEEIRSGAAAVMQGYTVLIAEAVRQVALLEAPALGHCVFTHVFVQAGVGGLAAAVAAWLTREFGALRPKLIIVEPERSDCLFESLRHGRLAPASGDLGGSMVMLACKTPSSLAWDILRTSADAFVTVTDDEADTAVMTARSEGIQTTTSGACGLAGALAGEREFTSRLGLGPDSRVLVIGTEGPNDLSAGSL